MVIREGDVEVIRQGLTFTRYFTTEGVHPFDQVEWETRDAVIPNFKEGGNAFEQRDVEFPLSWSQNATNIVAQKYFRGTLGTPQRETSVRQLVGRVVDTITGWGTKNGYFATAEDARVFAEELAHLLVNQKAAFNSPVWFNVGVPDTPQQCSACFILAVDDHMSSILNWYVEEGTIFKGGSGSGINLSRIRSSKEPLAVPPPASGSLDDRILLRLMPEPEPPLKIVPSSTYQLRIDCMVSSTERMKHADACWGVLATPMLNHTGELNAAFWWTMRYFSSSLKTRASASSRK